jgi:PEP-CTERM motif
VKTTAIVVGISAALALLSPAAMNATELELIYNGAFNAQDSLAPSGGSGGAFTDPTPFTINAWFSTSSPNLAPAAGGPFNGFRAYDPIEATITIAGTTYTMETIGQNPTAGVTVAIFDNNSFTPGRYATGILQQPPLDGAGIIGDFSGASPAFTAADIVPTVFTGFNGVGYGSGVCLNGTGGNCQLNAVTPFVLHNDGNEFVLTLGNYDAVYPGGQDAGMPGPVSPLNTAELVAVPEPGTFGLIALALAGCALIRRKRAA